MYNELFNGKIKKPVIIIVLLVLVSSIMYLSIKSFPSEKVIIKTGTKITKDFSVTNETSKFKLSTREDMYFQVLSKKKYSSSEADIIITTSEGDEVYKGKVTVSNDKMLHGIATPLVNFKEGKYKIQVKTKEGRLSGEKQFEITK